MRILHLVSYSLYSGPLPSTLRLACAQRRLGHDVWLAHDTKRGGFSPFEESADPHIEAASIAPPQKMTLSAKSSPIAIWRDVRTLKNLLKQILKNVLKQILTCFQYCSECDSFNVITIAKEVVFF